MIHWLLGRPVIRNGSYLLDVIPPNAGIHLLWMRETTMDFRLRGNDVVEGSRVVG